MCHRYIETASWTSRKQFTTQKLWPALDAKAHRKDTGKLAYELTGEEPEHLQPGSYFVGWRLVLMDRDKLQRIEGVFHLVNFDGNWKIEDIYDMAVDDQPLDPWRPLSTQIAFADSAGLVPTNKGANPIKSKSWYESPQNQRSALQLMSLLMKAGGAKKMVAAIAIAIAAGIAAFWRSLLNQTKVTPTANHRD